MALSQQTGIPYLITEHATMFQLHRDQISRKNNQYITQAFQRAAKVLCVSSAFRDVLAVYRAPQEIQVVGNVVDCDFFHQSDTKTANFTFLACVICRQKTSLEKGDRYPAQGVEDCPEKLSAGEACGGRWWTGTAKSGKMV